MDRNYPGTGFGDLGAGAGWSYERSAKASLVYGTSRSSHPESELLHRQTYATPHPLQGYATNHHPGSLSGLFDTGLHHTSPSTPDASVMNLISALESRGPQPPPSASSLLSQFRTPSWQTAMHTPGPPELFISGALPGSGSFPSSSALSAYQHPASFSSRSFPAASLSLQDTPTFSPTSNGLLSPHDPLLHIKAPSQSSLGFDRLLSSQGAAAAAYRGNQDPTGAPSAQASSARHLQSHQFNLLSSQLQDQPSQLYNASVFSSAQSQAQPQSSSAQERAVPRQDSVIKHYQRPTPAQSQLASSAAHSLQHYLSCGGAGYQQITPHPRHAGLSCSPLGDQSPSSDLKTNSRTEQYRPIIQPPYSSSSSSTSSSSAGKSTKSSSSSGYSSASSASQQPPPQTAPPPQTQQQQQQPPATSTSAPQSLPKSCLSGYGSPVPPGKTPTSALAGQTPTQQQTQSYSPNHPPTSHLAQSYGGFSSPQAQDLSSGAAAKGYGSLGGRSQSYSTDIYGTDSAYSSLPSSLGGAGSPSLGYGAPGHSPALLRSAGSSGGGGSSGAAYHIPDSSPSPSGSTGIIRPRLHSPVPPCPTQSPGGTGSNKYISSVLSPTFLASPQGYPDTRGPSSQPQPYHSNSSKAKADTSMLGVGSQRSQDEVDDDDEFLIQHLLQAQASPTPQTTHQHSQQPLQPTPQQAQPQPQSVVPTTDSGKGLSYDIVKTSEERYHPQSVIRTHSATSGGVGNSQHSASELHSFLSEPDKTLAPRSPMPHLSQHHPQQQQQQPSHHQSPQRRQSQQHSASELHSFLSEPDINLQPPLAHHIPQPSASSHSQPQPDTQLTPQQSQLDQQRSEQHQFDTVNPVEKADQNQQNNRFVPLTSICFPDSLLQDEDRSFFPGMEDMFCTEDYKSSCAGGAGPGQGAMNESHTGQEGMDTLKAGQSASGAGETAGDTYDIMGHHTADQAYEPYCHGLEEPSNNTMTLDLDSLKTHELPSTVNTEQLGLIQSQGSGMGMSSNSAPNSSGAKMSSVPGVANIGPGSGGLQSPIFCSSRPKKLLKSSSFHLLKERRDPNTLPKKSYAQEYEFEDDEDKADQPADIRLNSRRLPDLLPDLVSSCRKGGGSGSLSPLMGDIDFYHSSGYSSLGSHSLMPQEGPKKRGRKPTRPKREGPPRPRGRPRIRPMPEPYTPRGMMGELGGTTVGGGFSVEGRGRGRGRGSRDSLSGTDPALSDGSVGSAPSLGLSPGPPCSADSTRNRDKNKEKSQMMGEESKAGFVASFLDFLKTGKRPPDLDISPEMETDNGEDSPCKPGALRPLSPAPPPPPPPPQFGDGDGNSGLALGNCSSPKRLEDELKRNLETLPSFSSDEEDSVGKNQDLQKSISSAISALYDTPHLTSNMQTPLPPPTLQPQPQPQPSQSPLIPALQPPTLSHQSSMHTPHSPVSSSSPSHSPLPPLPISSPMPPAVDQEKNSLPQSPVASSSPSPPPPANLPQPATPPPASPPPPPPPASQKESPTPSPESATSPEEPPAPKITSLHLAQKQEDAAIVGESEEDDSESGGEGIFRERDEFVVRVEDIQTLKLALQTGREPPPIWRVQKALLQKFSPEIKDGQRQFCATSNYLGYFGDAKKRYQRIYVKFLENVNKKDYVRVCARRPWRRVAPAHRRQSLPRMASPSATQVPARTADKEEKAAPVVQRELREKLRIANTAAAKEQCEKREAPASIAKTKEREQEKEKQVEQPLQEKSEKRTTAAERGRSKGEKKAVERKEKEKPVRPPKSRPAKVKAEPPPKKRKKWLKEVPSSSDSESSDEAASENEMPVKGGVNNRAMREMFRSYVEMLVSTALDPDMIQALEDTDDELYLPPMRKIDGILSEQKRRLLKRVGMSSQHQVICTQKGRQKQERKLSILQTQRVRFGGKCVSRRMKRLCYVSKDLKLSAESYRIYSLYHSLHHYKYHTFLQCKKETNSIEQAAEDPGQEEVVQQCMANQSWLDSLFNSFIELLTLSTKA
uniref:Proline rich 12a n=1 Tax=Cynoglossus semilaevis TaxID=244447 RepID=A0A3P8WVA2_CYNSE